MGRTKILETKKQIQNRKRLGVLLRVLRGAFGLTQAGLAEASGLSFSAIAKFERGNLRLSDETLALVFAVFEVNGVAYNKRGNGLSVTLSGAFMTDLCDQKGLIWPID
jgi:transcriptional regulator with XRE-family HTH domain